MVDVSRATEIQTSSKLPPAELELAMNYYKRQVDELAGLNVKADSILSVMKHQLRQQKQGFSLLSVLQQSIGTQMEQSEIFTRTIKAINTTLNMDGTIVFTAGTDGLFQPSYWLGVDGTSSQGFESLKIDFQPHLTAASDYLLVNRQTEKTEFIASVKETLNIPYFVCLPIIVNDVAIAVLLSGRLKEVRPFYPPLDEGDINTFQAIAGFISASLTNSELYTQRRQAEEALRQLNEELENRVQERTTQLAQANQEITALNDRLKAENLRMSAELEITRQLQQMILPKEQELDQIPKLDIAGFMEPADEVGGDYYDVLQYDGRVKIGIGDVTGHGLESGVVMLMAQTAVRTLTIHGETDPQRFLNTINRVIHDNARRMNSYKNMTLALLDYQPGCISLSGQHEEMLVVRSGGEVECISTDELGFPIGIVDNIADFVAQTQIQLNPGDGVVLYTDGITEAEGLNKNLYGLERLIEIVGQNWQYSASEITQAVVGDVRSHVGEGTIYDDITLVVFKEN
ncbi:MAG: SpoIIE family protein phosphatase [Kastovskya adunca ATA6-11-RM4]|jgi:sigma-B regulation protein RsbU (phosphoserine phosphatase)|nr:SpoIIE family protein phosphatase [Kastovskya adunca ATA6-11-RM4]